MLAWDGNSCPPRPLNLAIAGRLALARRLLYGEVMPLLLPVVLGVLGMAVSLLPPADVQPAPRDSERSGSWFAMGLATALVVTVCTIAVHRLAQDQRRDAVATLGGH